MLWMSSVKFGPGFFMGPKKVLFWPLTRTQKAINSKMQLGRLFLRFAAWFLTAS